MMESQIASASIYTDFSGLAELKSKARSGLQGTVLEVAKQFEAMFMQVMLKSMRDATASLAEDVDGEQVHFYQQMFDQQIALQLANDNSIGLAAAFARQMGEPQPAKSAELPSRPKAAVASAGISPVRERQPVASPEIATQEYQAAVKPNGSVAQKESWQPDSQESFIRELWPHAARVASALGLQPEVLVAQAALETGWGKKMIRHDGDNAFNLFGIKADREWQGTSAHVSTLEYRGGVAAREIGAFRVYDSLADSMEDYARFIQENPRYEKALAKAGDANGYLKELQKAGYATDPRYAEKIGRIMDAEPFTKTLAELKESARTPMI